MSNIVSGPLKTPEVDPTLGKIVERIEAYVEGRMVTDTHKRELIAAYLSGMVSSLDMVSLKKGQQHILLPAVLHQKILNFAKGLGLQFE